MRMISFASRNAKEMLRDPINLAFGLGFPLVLILLLSAIQSSVPVSLFEIESLAPGICVFGLSFMTLFSATLISRDRQSALLQRLYTTPMTPTDFILGYTLPIIPISLIQSVVTYIAAICLGLRLSLNIIYSILFIIPISLLYIALGLLFGSILNDKQVGGVCGGLLTNLSAWLSGIWFDISLIGGAFEKVGKMLPFYHAVELERAILKGDFSDSLAHLVIVTIYAVIVLIGASLLFLRQMKKQ